MQRHKLRARILTPIGIALAVLIAAHVIGVHTNQQSQLQARLHREVQSVEEELAQREEGDSDLLMSTLSAIEINPRFQSAFVDRDRTALFDLAAPLFADLKVRHDITHLYFSEPNKVNFLRVHRPELYGDRITRHTTLQAERLNEPFVGIDLGRFRALLTLRAVTPWHFEGELIGYIELGKEIVGITEGVASYEGVDVLVMLKKQLVEREYWESGMIALGRNPDWSRFPDWVLVESTMATVPRGLESFFDASVTPDYGNLPQSTIERADTGRQYMSHLIPIDDAAGTTVGQLAVVIDVTDAIAKANTPIWVLAAITFAIGVILFGFFFSYLGNIEKSIGERDLLEKQLRHSRRRESIGQLAGGVAHSFNNVLTAIRGFTELALRDIDSRDNVVTHLKRVEAASDSAAGLVDGLLTFSREHPMHSVVLDLNALIKRFLSMLERVVDEDVTLTFVPDEFLGYICSDPALLEQVILELVINARDAMPHGGELEVRTRRVVLDDASRPEGFDVSDGEYASIVVSDTGSGIPVALLANVFEPFVTTKAVGQGTGLGLSIVKGIVQQLQGEIAVESNPCDGTRFSLYLPVTSQPLVQRAEAPTIEKRSGNGERVLIVENDDDIRYIGVNHLESLGYRVSSAVSAEEAQDIVDEHESFDILVTDILMRGTSGIQLAHRMRRDNSRLKVIYISGYPSVDQTTEFSDNSTILLMKPFSLSDLAQTIRSLIDETPP